MHYTSSLASMKFDFSLQYSPQIQNRWKLKISRSILIARLLENGAFFSWKRKGRYAYSHQAKCEWPEPYSATQLNITKFGSTTTVTFHSDFSQIMRAWLQMENSISGHGIPMIFRSQTSLIVIYLFMRCAMSGSEAEE
ncbi:hypothetical protein A3780_01825 [Kosakonia radicincitans]|nr:hypothetical protein A3780_01825 [Kosakonia radicincitans]